MDKWLYLRNQWLKQTNLVDLQFLSNYTPLPKTDAEGCWKRNLEDESILYNSTELSVDWTTRDFQNQNILFSRKMKFSI